MSLKIFYKKIILEEKFKGNFIFIIFIFSFLEGFRAIFGQFCPLAYNVQPAGF